MIPSFINESNEFMAFRLLDFIIYPIPLYLKIGRTLKKKYVWLLSDLVDVSKLISLNIYFKSGISFHSFQVSRHLSVSVL